MDVFTLRDNIISDYTDYVRSFIDISNDAIREKVEQEFKEGLLWPNPLLQLNPAFASGKTIDALVEEGTLHEDCAKIFRVAKSENDPHGYPMSLYKHQSDAIRAAQQGHNYVLTTGTGSGKSLSYIIPIVDYILKYKGKNQEQAQEKSIKAIIVYPMNALANSQELELEKFLGSGGTFPVTYRRYTGEVSQDERRKICANAPDIILTNYVMLELILTRHSERPLVQSAANLQFLVFDELHTYRGRQGADVSMLIRRLRNMITEMNPESNIQCIGTSATMAGADTFAEQRKEVSAVSSKLFGTEVLPDNVIVETLKQETSCKDYGTDQFFELLREDVLSSMKEDIVSTPEEDYERFIQRPFVSWIEHTLGIRENDKEKGVLIRCTPKPISGEHGIASLLAEKIGLPEEECIEPIKRILLQGYSIKNPSTKKPVFAFRLHQFLNRGDTVYASLEPEETRSITLYAQHLAANREENVVLFPLFFCRECGKEYYRVWKSGDKKNGYTYLPYNPGYFDRDGSEDVAGYIFFDEKDSPWPSSKEEQLALLPEAWVEEKKSGQDVKKNHKSCMPERIYIFKNGKAGTAKDKDASPAWFTLAPFSCCFGSCHTAYENNVKGDFSKLATLGTEGRSTSTTILSLATVRYLREEKDLKDIAKKLLCFSDNRQDASLQAGHFNDFVEVSLIRSALFTALEKAAKETEEAGLQYDVLAMKVFEAMGEGFKDKIFPMSQYADDPDVAPDSFHAKDVRSAFINLLKYRIYSDLRRGWRIVAPNLEQSGLLIFDYKGLDSLCKSDDNWKENNFLFNLEPEKRKELADGILLFMRQHLAINVDCLTEETQNSIKEQSVQVINKRWKIDQEETLCLASRIYPRQKSKEENKRSTSQAIYVSPYSNLGKKIRDKVSSQESPLSALETREVIQTLFKILRKQGILIEKNNDKKHDDPWYQIQASSMIWKAGDGTKGVPDPLRVRLQHGKSARTNPFFVHLYRSVAKQGLDIEAKEHTAQVPNTEREAREEAFRDARLPILYCSPTMELGVDISQLNAVAMRNVPPTPANYAQRSGRAGRSGQPALIITYCSRGNSHDQHFFQRPEEMVAGSVSTPRIDLANEDLIRAHIHSIWLTKTELDLKDSLHELINIDNDVEKTPEGEEGLLLKTNGQDGQEISLKERLPLQESIEASLHSESAISETTTAASQILADMKGEFADCGWYTKDWLGEVATRIPKDFEDACDRWRILFHAAKLQQYKQNLAANNYALSAQDRKIAQQLRREAESQLSILLQEKNKKDAGDFDPYRYFASEGFLPGYNFPRLPLSAYIPGDSVKQKDDTYISRARFLAISEFGPRNLLYYEGNKYIINRVIMDTPSENESLATASYKFCTACGYVHGIITTSYNPDICEFCGEPLPQAMTNLFRMRNVIAQKRERITSDEEERFRCGYDLRTGFRFVEHGGVKSHRDATAYRTVDKSLLIKMQYGHGAVLWRINLGWRNRAQETSPGFYFNPVSGAWVEDNKKTINSKQTIEDVKGAKVERIIPYVQDRKNCLLLTPLSLLLTDPKSALSLLGQEDKIADIEPEDLVSAVLYSLQSALKQAIQIVYQLEDVEIATEVLPATGTPKYILFIESAEGGAGVLRRLVDDKNAIATVAKEALRICHFSEEGQDLLKSPHAKENCVHACYDCLMNYGNQRVHALLNRHIIVDFLLQLAQSTIDTAKPALSRTEQLKTLQSQCDSQLERDWLQFLFDHNYTLPDEAQYYIKECHTKPDFWYEESRTAIYIDGPVHNYEDIAKKDAEQEECLEDNGIGVLRFIKGEQWHAICKEYPDIFGTQE